MHFLHSFFAESILTAESRAKAASSTQQAGVGLGHLSHELLRASAILPVPSLQNAGHGPPAQVNLPNRSADPVAGILEVWGCGISIV